MKTTAMVVLIISVARADTIDTIRTDTDSSLYEGRIISKIQIVRKNVFDDLVARNAPFYYSWANSLHIVTRERIVRNELLFKVGDSLNSEKIFESKLFQRDFAELMRRAQALYDNLKLYNEQLQEAERVAQYN